MLFAAVAAKSMWCFFVGCRRQKKYHGVFFAATAAKKSPSKPGG